MSKKSNVTQMPQQQPEIKYVSYPEPLIVDVINVLRALQVPPQGVTVGQLSDVIMALRQPKEAQSLPVEPDTE